MDIHPVPDSCGIFQGITLWCTQYGFLKASVASHAATHKLTGMPLLLDDDSETPQVSQS